MGFDFRSIQIYGLNNIHIYDLYNKYSNIIIILYKKLNIIYIVELM